MSACGIKYRGLLSKGGPFFCTETAGHGGPQEGATPHVCGPLSWWDNADLANVMAKARRPNELRLEPKRPLKLSAIAEARAAARAAAFAECAEEAERRACAILAEKGRDMPVAAANPLEEMAEWARGRR
jgi:hypothetical protein